MEPSKLSATDDGLSAESHVSVLSAGDDDAVDALVENSGFDVRPVSGDLGDGLDDIDCVVVDCDSRDPLDALSTVREQDPTVPVVMMASSPSAGVLDAVTDSEWTDLAHKGDAGVTATLLAGRVEALVAHRRAAAHARRTGAALEETRCGAAVVDPDGRFSVVDRSFARRVGRDRETLQGRDWRTCFPSAEADRLESTALERVRDDWRWTGGCVVEQPDGDTFYARARIVGLEDGSFVVVLTDPPDE